MAGVTFSRDKYRSLTDDLFQGSTLPGLGEMAADAQEVIDAPSPPVRDDYMRPQAPESIPDLPSFEEMFGPDPDAPRATMGARRVQPVRRGTPTFESMFGPDPEAPSPYSGALTTLGGTPEAEAVTRPGGSGYVAPAVDDGSLQSYSRMAAQRAGIDPDIFTAQIQQESGFREGLTSPAGARGIAQIVPRFHPNVNPDNPREALDYAANLMASHLKSYGGDYAKALAAYNAGPGAVAQYGGVPPFQETQTYVRNILQGRNGSVQPAASTAMPAPGETVSRAFDLNSIAQQWSDKRYVFGGAGGRGGGLTDTDCSGFVAEVKKQQGVELPAHTDAAYTTLQQRGAVAVGQEQARPGDVVFYMGAGTGGAITHHMGIFAGPGKVLDMSAAGGGGVKVRDIGHAGKYEILRDPTDPTTPPAPAKAAPPVAIVHAGVAEQTGGTKPTDEQIDAWSQMGQSFSAGTDRIKGLTYEQAQAADRDFTGRGSMAMEDLSGQTPDTTTQDASGLPRGGSIEAGGDSGATGSVAGVAGPPTRDVRGDYAPRAVEPGDFELAPPPPAETVGTPSSSLSPGGAVEPTRPVAPPTEAPASSGNPIVDLFSEMGRKLSSILQPANTAAVEALNQGADVIGETFARGREEPSPSQQIANTALRMGGDVLESNAENWSNVAAKVTGDRIGHRMTPEEQREATERSIRIIEENPFAPGVYSAVPEVIGLASTSREALDRLAAQRRAGGRSPAPAAGIVGRGADEAAPAMFPESLDKITNATAGTRGGFLPDRAPTGVEAAAVRATGAGAGSAYDESQREGSTPESIATAALGAAGTSLGNAAAGRVLPGAARRSGLVSRAVQEGGREAGRTTAFSPIDPNTTYDLRHRIVDLGDLITSHRDDFKPNPRFPSELQPRFRDRAAAAAQVQRIANELNPDALLADTRSIQTGSPIIGPDNIVESGNGRVMALRQAVRRNPEAAARYREEVARAAADYGIDPAELRGKRFPVLVRERLSDVDRKAFAREANESATAVVSGFERSLGDAELLTDDLIKGLTVNEGQSIDQALSAPGNRGIVRAFTQALPQNEAGTMVDAMGNLSEEGVRRVKQALIIKAYGNSVTGQRMARSMIESIDPGVKNVETAIYGSLPSVARLESISKRGDLSVSDDIAKAADMYARLKQNNVRISDYLTQGSMWERETTPIQDALIQVFDSNKRSARRIREVLEGYVARAEPQANPSQVDLFGGDLSRASKDDILDAAIRATVGDDVADAAARAADQGLESGRFAQEAADAGPVSPIEGVPGPQAPRPPAPPVREGLDSGAAGRRVTEYRESGPATATLDEGATPPRGPVRIGSDSLQPELPGTEPGRGLYVGEARRRTQKSLDDAMAKGEPITLTDEQEIKRLRLDKFPEEIRDELITAARNADWFRTQRRGVVPDVEVQAASSRMWASIDDAIKRGAAGKAYSPEETVALRNLLRGQTELVQDYARRLAEPMTKDMRDKLVAEQLAEAQKLTGLFQVVEGARAEAGRTLRQYREFARSLKDNPEEAGIRYIRQRFGSMDGAEKVVATYTQMVQDGASPVELAGFLRSVRPAWMDRLNIIRYGSMLSSTTTHLRNIAGNVINIGQDIGLKPLAVGIDVARAGITGGQRTRYMGEVSEMGRGMLEGLPTGLRDLATTLRTGVNPNEIQTIDNLRGGFGSGSGKVDALAEAPLRALSGADAFFRAVTLGGHTRAVAFRKASQEGLTGTARADRVQDIVENLYRNLDVLDEASKASARDILQEDRRAVRAAMQMREGMNGVVPYLGDVMLPFVRTPINIAAQGIEMSPLGFASVIKDARAGRTGEATDTAARALFGTALMYSAGTLAMNNMLTGGYPEDARTRSTLPPGWQPYSLKLGDQYVQYSNLGPFGIPIATAVIVAEAKKSGKPIDPGAVVMSMGKYLGDQTFMRGLSDFVKAFNDPTRYGENVVENIGTQLAPYAALGRQIERAMGMTQKDPHGAWEALQATYPFSAGNVTERTDSRGQPIRPSQTGVESFISPTNISREQPDPVLDVLRKQGIGIGAPPKALVVERGRTVELTQAQQQLFQRFLYAELRDSLGTLADPDGAEQAMGRARDRARANLLSTIR